jgi:hypothetical protein
MVKRLNFQHQFDLPISDILELSAQHFVSEIDLLSLFEFTDKMDV